MIDASAKSSCLLILYDGVCGLCNRFVQFVLKHDHRDRFRFAPLQSDYASDLLNRHSACPTEMNSIYVVSHVGEPQEKIVARSAAALTVLRELGGIWRMLANIGGIFPEALRDLGYRIIAANRYRVFGKYDACPLPDPKHRHKFVGA